MISKLFVKLFSLTTLVVLCFSANCQFSLQVPLFKSINPSEKNIFLFDSTKHKKSNNGFYFGVNMGFYFANRYTAQYYNGSEENKTGVNKVDSVINYPLNYQNIKQVLIYDFYLPKGGLPIEMKYSPAFLIGFFTKYNFKNSGIFMQFNFCKLKTNDVFTLVIKDPNNFSSEPEYKQEAISGSEQRANIDIGYSYTFYPKKKNRPYIELGYNINSTKFIDNKIKIENLEYSIANYYYTYYNIKQSGVGMGGFFGSGVELNFSESISVNPGFDIYWTKINLGNYNDKLKFNYSIFIRAILNGLL